jgi:hypothetical protein
LILISMNRIQKKKSLTNLSDVRAKNYYTLITEQRNMCFGRLLQKKLI